MIEFGNIITQEVVIHLLNECTCLHVCLHIDFLHLETCILEHLLNGNDVGMTSSPRKRRHGGVYIITSSLGNLKNGSHAEAWSGMTVILNHDVLLVSLDTFHYLAQRYGTADACHILQADFICSCINKGLGQIDIILHCMNGAVSDTQSGLGYHASFLGILNGREHITRVVQTAEDTCDICSLCLLDLIEKLAQVLRTGTHAKAVQCTVQHVCLYAGLMKRLCPLAYTLVRVFTIEQIDLLKTTTICLHTVKATHSDNGRSHFYQLVHTWLIFTSTLPHVAENQAKLYFSFHLRYLVTFFP